MSNICGMDSHSMYIIKKKIRKERTDNFGKNKKTTYHVNTNDLDDVVFL